MTHNTYQAEAAVLGSLLIDSSLIKECALEQEYFEDRRHQIIFRAMRALEKKGTPIDPTTLVSLLGDALEQIGGVDYINDLASSVATTANFSFHEEVVIDAYRLRESIQKAQSFTEAPDEGKAQLLIDELKALQELSVRKSTRTKKDILLDVAERMHADDIEMTGYTSGLRELDHMTGGWQKQDLVIVAARPSMGKTAFALGIGSAHCRNNGVTTIFSLEMPDVQLAFRWLSAEGNIDGHKWKNPKKLFSAADYEKATNAIGVIEKWDFEIIDDANVTVTDIRQRMSEIKRKYPGRDHLVIIDYLQLIRSARRKATGENRQQEVTEISRALKLMARELDIPVIALSQLSRGVESRQDKRPMMSDIRESGSIEQDADVISFLYRDDYYNKESENQNIVEVIIAKQRNGPIGTVETAFIKEYGKFVNLDRVYN
ncbi:replicative DNA helicase [Halalkalibacter oceani]|uniref:replicative DNA helicase n=1 Tax=Halalkalibacter oceani TaxID=1653776 RepID=UPI0033961698